MADHLTSQPASTIIGHPAVVVAAPEHTPTPWDYVPSTEHHGPYITSDYGGTIADLYTMSHPTEWSTANGGRSKPIPFFHEMADPNAALIVKAVNAHEALVSALKAIEAGSFPDAANLAISGDWHSFVDRLQAIARAALAQVQSA